MDKTHNRVVGNLIGLAVEDALGTTIELSELGIEIVETLNQDIT